MAIMTDNFHLKLYYILNFRYLPANALVLPKIFSSLSILRYIAYLMSTKPLIKTHQVALFNRALSQTGELDQPMVHPSLTLKQCVKTATRVLTRIRENHEE